MDRGTTRSPVISDKQPDPVVISIVVAVALVVVVMLFVVTVEVVAMMPRWWLPCTVSLVIKCPTLPPLPVVVLVVLAIVLMEVLLIAAWFRNT
jgi:uncharacterized membrane protein